MIVRVPTGNIVEGAREVTKKNSGDGFVHGVELEAQFQLHPQVAASASFAALNGELDTFPTSDPIKVREPLSQLSPTSAAVGLEWNGLEGKTWFGGLVRMSTKQTRLSPPGIV